MQNCFIKMNNSIDNYLFTSGTISFVEPMNTLFHREYFGSYNWKTEEIEVHQNALAFQSKDSDFSCMSFKKRRIEEKSFKDGKNYAEFIQSFCEPITSSDDEGESENKCDLDTVDTVNKVEEFGFFCDGCVQKFKLKVQLAMHKYRGCCKDKSIPNVLMYCIDSNQKAAATLSRSVIQQKRGRSKKTKASGLNERFSCSQCEDVVHSKLWLAKHRREFHGFNCTLCSYTSLSPTYLKKHTNKMHTSPFNRSR